MLLLELAWKSGAAVFCPVQLCEDLAFKSFLFHASDGSNSQSTVCVAQPWQTTGGVVTKFLICGAADQRARTQSQTCQGTAGALKYTAWPHSLVNAGDQLSENSSSQQTHPPPHKKEKKP